MASSRVSEPGRQPWRTPRIPDDTLARVPGIASGVPRYTRQDGPAWGGEGVMHEVREERAGVPFWAAVAALAASASYLLARFIHLGPLSGPWAYWPINGVLCGLLFRRAPRTWPAIALAAGAAQV